jgi:hypothetical protein
MCIYKYIVILILIYIYILETFHNISAAHFKQIAQAMAEFHQVAFEVLPSQLNPTKPTDFLSYCPEIFAGLQEV